MSDITKYEQAGGYFGHYMKVDNGFNSGHLGFDSGNNSTGVRVNLTRPQVLHLMNLLAKALSK